MHFFDDDLTLRTEHLLLRRLRPEDAEPLFSLFNNWNVVRFLSSPPWPYEPASSNLFVGGVGRAFVRPERGRACNHARRRVRRPHRCAAARAQCSATWPGPDGYWLGEPFWGRGFMTEAVRAVIRHVFHTTPADAIYSGAFTENAASLRVQEKVGFARDADAMLFSKPRGAALPHVNTVLTCARFEQLSGGM